MPARLLGLPLQSPRLTLGATLALLAYYLWSMSRSLSMYDSPELALVAEQLGLGHPFGQPLHTLVGALAARLPGTDSIVMLNALSAVAGALTLVPATSFAEANVRADLEDRSAVVRFIPFVIAWLALYPALWEPSTRIEVYSLAVFFSMWSAARVSHALVAGETNASAYLLAGLALGFGASTNLVCAAAVGVAMTPQLLLATARGTIPVRSTAVGLAGLLAGLSPYLYVPWAAQRRGAFVWGRPDDGDALVHYFTAADFAGKQTTSIAQWSQHVLDWVLWGTENGLVFLLLGGAAGFSLFRSRGALGGLFYAIVTILLVAFIARNGAFAPDVLDYLGYLAAPTWLSASGIAMLIAWLRARRSWVAGLVLLALFVVVMIATPSPLARTRSIDRYTADLARRALEAAPENAILIVEQDHWVAPLWYLQQQHGIRPDVAVLAFGLTSSSWYWEQLYAQHPDLAQFSIAGPGGRDGRVGRFLAANSDRPVQVQNVPLASRLRLPVCPSPWLLDAGRSCAETPALPEMAIHAQNTLRALNVGSPGTASLIALITLDRGHDLWIHGLPRAAIATLLAGVPPMAGLDRIDLGRVPFYGRQRSHAPPQYQPRVALGNAARNLDYAAKMAEANGAADVAAELRKLSDRLPPVTSNFAELPSPPASL